MIFTVPTAKTLRPYIGPIGISIHRIADPMISRISQWHRTISSSSLGFPARKMGVAPDGMGYSYDLGKPFKNLLLIIDHISTVINHIYQRSFNHQ